MIDDKRLGLYFPLSSTTLNILCRWRLTPPNASPVNYAKIILKYINQKRNMLVIKS